MIYDLGPVADPAQHEYRMKTETPTEPTATRDRTMFEKELAYFIAHQDELVQKYSGKTVIIRGDTLEGVFGTALEAYLYAKDRFEPGTYMIQECLPGPDAYTVTINSSIAA